MTELTQTFTSAGPSFRGRFAALRTALAEAARKRAVYHNTLRELGSLTDRELNDMGIAPSSIKAIAYEAAYGK